MMISQEMKEHQKLDVAMQVQEKKTFFYKQPQVEQPLPETQIVDGKFFSFTRFALQAS